MIGFVISAADLHQIHLIIECESKHILDLLNHSIQMWLAILMASASVSML